MSEVVRLPMPRPPRADEYGHLTPAEAHKLALMFVEMAYLTANWVHLPEHLTALRMRSGAPA